MGPLARGNGPALPGSGAFHALGVCAFTPRRGSRRRTAQRPHSAPPPGFPGIAWLEPLPWVSPRPGGAEGDRGETCMEGGAGASGPAAARAAPGSFPLSGTASAQRAGPEAQLRGALRAVRGLSAPGSPSLSALPPTLSPTGFGGRFRPPRAPPRSAGRCALLRRPPLARGNRRHRNRDGKSAGWG